MDIVTAIRIAVSKLLEHADANGGSLFRFAPAGSTRDYALNPMTEAERQELIRAKKKADRGRR